MNEINPNNAKAGNLPISEMPIADTATPGNSEDKNAQGVLNGPSLTVTPTNPTIVASLRQASYDSAMATAKNLVDSPEQRREKAARRKEEESEKEALEADLKRADEKRELLDEIDSQRQASV